MPVSQKPLNFYRPRNSILIHSIIFYVIHFTDPCLLWPYIDTIPKIDAINKIRDEWHSE